MSKPLHKPPLEDQSDKQIQENLTNWQNADNPLAPLTEEQLDLYYELGDCIKEVYSSQERTSEAELPKESGVPVINTNRDFVRWMIGVEKEMQYESLRPFQGYFEDLKKHLKNSEDLLGHSESTVSDIGLLKRTYKDVIDKTNYLHHLSEQLMVHQQILKQKKIDINDKLRYFVGFDKCQEKIEHMKYSRVNSSDYTDELTFINSAIVYLEQNSNFKEAKVYKMKYESLLASSLLNIFNYVNTILTETTKSVTLSEAPDPDAVFAIYYGKFQSASAKMKQILNYVEENTDSYYENTLYDVQKCYFGLRLPMIEVAISKALNELKDKHKQDYSVLFRSCCIFTIKVCLDEARCYNYFFDKPSQQLHDYLSSLCQHLYDTLRPCLILINYIEILSELCGILKNEMLSDKVTQDANLVKYCEIIRQLLEDVEERLVFRTNVFFKHDLNDYKPSPGDLAYPEKLQQLENVMELTRRSESRSSMDSQSHDLRSYTGNSPADLHGMWYPTVKRTLVCLSRLYFCLDKDTFQGLAQEALIVCVRTVQNATSMISSRKTPIDGKLFQIKHLLIIREQIAPFQVDFTTKELSLDFTNIQKAALGLINKRKQIFSFNSNNALLEFLLEGTPKVKEYLIDSRKEIDKQLKLACEAFISYVTKMLLGNLMNFIEKAEKILKIIRVENASENDLTVKGQGFGRPENVADLLKEVQKAMKLRIPEVQRSMQLYLANRETEFILFRPIKNNVVNAFMQLEGILQKGGYSTEDQVQIGAPSPEQVNILICSVSLAVEQDG